MDGGGVEEEHQTDETHRAGESDRSTPATPLRRLSPASSGAPTGVSDGSVSTEPPSSAVEVLTVAIGQQVSCGRSLNRATT